MTRFLILTIPLVFAACAEFPTGRSFLSEMEHDDSSFYEPNHDFPVVGGDSEVTGMSADEYRTTRMPRSAEEKTYDRETQLLREELRALESSQPDEEREFYEAHKSKLATRSEKIYYLKLPRSERREYLRSRGLTERDRSPASVSESLIPRRSTVAMGMTKNDVAASLGKPMRVEIAGNPSYENERWVYQFNGASKYIYFESGLVQGWE